MEINHTNVEVEINKMTTSLIMINYKLKERIEKKQWIDVIAAIEEEGLFDFDIGHFNEIEAYLKKDGLSEYPKGSTAANMLDQAFQFFENLAILNFKGKV